MLSSSVYFQPTFPNRLTIIGMSMYYWHTEEGPTVLFNRRFERNLVEPGYLEDPFLLSLQEKALEESSKKVRRLLFSGNIYDDFSKISLSDQPTNKYFIFYRESLFSSLLDSVVVGVVVGHFSHLHLSKNERNLCVHVVFPRHD